MYTINALKGWLPVPHNIPAKIHEQRRYWQVVIRRISLQIQEQSCTLKHTFYAC